MKVKGTDTEKKFKMQGKLTLCVVLFAILFFTFKWCLENSLSAENKYSLNYTEKSDINYNVCLKENNFYEEKCIGKDMKYVAGLIDKINLNMRYTFTTDMEVDSTYNYSAIGKVIITDPVDNKTLFSKNYNLIEEKSIKQDFSKEFIINEVIDIDYSSYNSLANEFKSTYGLNSNSKLEIYLIVNNQGNLSNYKDLEFKTQPNLYISIPLTEKSVDITINKAVINITDTINSDYKLIISNYYYFIGTILSTIFIILVTFYLVKTITKYRSSKSDYEKKISKLLREYDRLIVESNTNIDPKMYNLIVVKSFEELLDVHDNLKSPIILNEIVKKRESWFYIKANSDLYLYALFNKN